MCGKLWTGTRSFDQWRYEAHRSHVPMLVIASTIPSDEMGMDYFQETNTIKLFDDCSHYNQMITRPEQVQRTVQTAIQHAISKKEWL
jgi:pyruvate dehydrogenase (quinone)